MSGLVINLTCNDEPRHIDSRSGPTGNAKHKRFLKKRRYQEQRGHSNDRQNKFKQSDRNKVRNHQKGTQHRQKEGESSQPPAVFPKFSPSKPELSSYPSSSSTHTPVTNDLSQDTVKKHPPGSGLSPANSQASTHLPRNVGSLFGNPLKYLAIDCEMVGTGPQGRNSELARCSIVAYNGDIVYDKYIRPINPVTDFRTRWSGIRAHHLRSAVPFVQAKKEILKILLGKVVVGHAIHNDLKALSYSHPACLIRDTARIPLLNKKAGLPETQPASLKRLTKALFNVNIQTGRDGHSSVEDAKATMELYKVVEVEWERTLASKAMT